MSSYSIWVLEYAFVPNYPLSGLIYGAHNKGTTKLPYCYILIKGRDLDGTPRLALVDVGYNHAAYGEKLATQFGVKGWQPPTTVLAECGVTPADITDVFLTHAHFDHMGNVEAFPNARFYIQERELSKWVWTMTLDRRFRWLMLGIDPADILRVVDLAKQGRLVAVEGTRENVLPGIDLHPAFDSHTWGSMYVRLRNDLASESGDAWVFAGDLVYQFENLRGYNADDPEYIPIGFASGSQFNLLMTTENMVRHAGGDWRRVIAGHEERIKDLYPSRIAATGLRISELALADGEPSRVR